MASSEHQTVLRLRALITVIFALGVVAAVFNTGGIRFLVVCYFIPGTWAYMKPRWPAILFWIMWASTFAMLAFFLALGGRTHVLRSPTYVVMAFASALLFFVVPLVRRMHEAPILRGQSRIPEARIHREAP